MQVSPVSCCFLSTASASAHESDSGISTCTCLPASMQAIACSACICVGVHRITASTSSRSSSSLSSVPECGAPYLAATSAACSARREITEAISTPSMFLRPSRCFSPNAPAPASAIRNGSLLSVPLPLAGGVRGGRVGGGGQAHPRPLPQAGGEEG